MSYWLRRITSNMDEIIGTQGVKPRGYLNPTVYRDGESFTYFIVTKQMT